MNVEDLQVLIDEGLSSHEIAKKLNCSQTNIRFWLKKFGLKTIRSLAYSDRPRETIKKCGSCQIQKGIEEFYLRRRDGLPISYCKDCSKKQVVVRNQEMKRKCVDYKGGKCERCAYDKCNAALEFHHTDPSSKDFDIATVKNVKFSDLIKQELDKCMLLCCNCHREIHQKIYNESLI